MTSRKKLSVLLLTIALFISPFLVCFIPTTQMITDVIVLESKQGAGGQGQYVVVPITVYQVEGSTITPQQVQDMIKRLNKLHNCEVVVYVWNGIILPIPDPDGGHGSGPGVTGDVEYPEANDDGEHGNLSSAVNNHPMNPTNPGVQIVVCNNIVNDSGHSVAGGYAYSGQGPIVISDHCAVDPSWGGRAWAHEIGHFYGLDHNGNNESRPNNNGLVTYDSNGDGTVNGGDVQGSDGNGDGWVTAADQNYNMYGGFPPGTDYTPTQHSQMFNSAKAIPGAEVRPLPASGRPPPPPNIPVQISGNHTAKPINHTGPVPTNNHRNVDLVKFNLFRNITINFTKISLIVNGTISAFDPNYWYAVIISNNKTAMPPNNEYLINISQIGVEYSKRDEGFTLWTPLNPLPTELTQISSIHNTTVTGDIINLTSGVDQATLDTLVNNTQLNADLENSTYTLELNGTFVNEMFGNDKFEGNYGHNITVIAQQLDSGHVINDSIFMENAYIGPDEDFPCITIEEADEFIAGEIFNVIIYGFEPLTGINISIDGEIIHSMTTDANGNATFSHSISVAKDNHYVLAVNGTSNETSAMYVHINAVSSGTPPIPGFELIFLILGIGIVCVFLTIQRKHKLESVEILK